MSIEVGSVVKYREGETVVSALVLGKRNVADHAGENGEPLLTLCFAKERKDAFGNPLPLHGTGQQSELIQIRTDVAHESHEYDEDQQAKYGRKAYDGGRWSA